MTKKLNLSPALQLPLSTVTCTGIAYGGRGMGKTNLGAVIAEELDACKLRWSWLDPLGVGWGIRHSASGTDPGVKCLILGGVRGDIPIYPDSGAAVAETVVEETCNVLIDFSRKVTGEMWGVGEKIRFVTAYAQRLFQLQGSLINGRRREPLLQILDEGARFIPQTVPAGNPALSLCTSAWQQFAEEGRNVGLGLFVLTQRSARINKDIAELADVMFAFRTVGPNSLDAIIDWLGTHVRRDKAREMAEQVRKLPRGSALVVSPGWLEVEKIVPIRMRHTFDSSDTPKPGERTKIAKGPGAKPDLEKIRVRMAATIERAKAEDPKEMRRRIAELEKEVAKKVFPVPLVKGVVLAKHQVIVDERQISRIEKRVAEITAAMKATLDPLGQQIKDLLRQVSPETDSEFLKKWSYAPRQRSPMSKEISIKIPGPGEKLPVGEKAILIAVAQNGGLGVTKEQLTVNTGYKRSSRDAYIHRLVAKGYAERSGDLIVANEAGIQALGSDYQPLPIGSALLEHWLGRLPEGERIILEFVASRYPNIVDREHIDSHTGYKRSSRDAYIHRLKARKLITVSREGVKMSELLT